MPVPVTFTGTKLLTSTSKELSGTRASLMQAQVGRQDGRQLITYEEDEDLIMWGLEDYLEEMDGQNHSRKRKVSMEMSRMA